MYSTSRYQKYYTKDNPWDRLFDYIPHSTIEGDILDTYYRYAERAEFRNTSSGILSLSEEEDILQLGYRFLFLWSPSIIDAIFVTGVPTRAYSVYTIFFRNRIGGYRYTGL